jgi:translation elongation factor EF-G
MRIKKKLSEAQLEQRRHNAAAAKARGKKEFVTMRVEPDARNLVRDYVADRKNKVDTISKAIRKKFE